MEKPKNLHNRIFTRWYRKKIYRERTFNKDLLLVQDIWVDHYGELILDYEYASDYSSFKCYATEDDEKYLYYEYYIKKTSTGYNDFYHHYYPDGDIYAASKYSLNSKVVYISPLMSNAVFDLAFL